MTQQEIDNGIAIVCNTSKDIQSYYENIEALVIALNGVSKENLKKCMEFYNARTGVIIDLRKEIISELSNDKPLTAKSLQSIIDKHKKGKEKQFKSYKEPFSLLFPILTFYAHNPIRQFVKNFTAKLTADLDLTNKVKTTSFDFQGARQQGSDRYWLAIYNANQENQSTGLQFFIEFHHGKMSYGIFQYSNHSYIKDKVAVTPEEFNYENMLNYFKPDVDLLINDVPHYEDITTINLENHKLYKISHGTFKANKRAHIVEALKQNNWITLHENTGKDQSKYFKEKLNVGDYVYITLGSKELIGIAQIDSEDWDYVPNEIIEEEGWMFREVKFIKAPVRKNPKDLKDTKNIYPSGNSTLTEIKKEALKEANEKLFLPFFNLEFTGSGQTNTNLKSMGELSQFPLNQILYGPPGTGKTYNTVWEAGKIITGNKDITYDESLTVFNDNMNDRIEFITFHQNYSYEDFIQGLRPDTENGNALTFEKKDGVFKRIADRALFEYYIASQKNKAKAKPQEVFLDVNEAYLDFFSSLKVGQVFTTKTGVKIIITILRTNKSIVFKYEKGLRPVAVSSNRLLKLYSKIPDINEITNVNDDIRGAIGGCDATVYYTVLNEFIKFYESDKKKIQDDKDYQNFDYSDITEERKKEILSQITLEDLRSVEVQEAKSYVIIIDEINRANISRVFGELITLIEEDKRSHGKIPMRVTLPSGDTFIVPSNLYIVGTMNTADKSIALLDIALRRRFEFIPKYPDLTLDAVNDKEILAAINSAILNSGKNHDFTIGHAYFMEERYSLEKTINHKVIPLLLEYFMNSEDKVKEILGKAGITIEDWPLKMKP